VHQHLLQQGQVDLLHVQADELWVKLVGRRVWMALALAGVDNLTAPLYRLSTTWHTRSTHAAPHERSALFPHIAW
jgi:hypothetical protein